LNPKWGSVEVTELKVYKEEETKQMTAVSWVEIPGAVAGICTTFAFVPQLVKIYRQGGRDLCYGMLSLYLAGVLQ
jgi:hypothetical protein